MRLTLRTLLAYLDDLLEPQQARELGERISRSEEAAGMVSRIRNVLRRRRIDAPAIDAEQPDANVVAGYLDNQLQPADVEAFERTALTDDVVLAEAAATHQILSVVLGEPVTVPPELRLKIYGLAGMDAGPPTEQPAVPVVGRQSSPQLTLPDPPAATPEKRSAPWPAMLGLAVVLLWGAALAWWVSQPEDGREVAVMNPEATQVAGTGVVGGVLMDDDELDVSDQNDADQDDADQNDADQADAASVGVAVAGATTDDATGSKAIDPVDAGIDAAESDEAVFADVLEEVTEEMTEERAAGDAVADPVAVAAPSNGAGNDPVTVAATDGGAEAGSDETVGSSDAGPIDVASIFAAPGGATMPASEPAESEPLHAETQPTEPLAKAPGAMAEPVDGVASEKPAPPAAEPTRPSLDYQSIGTGLTLHRENDGADWSQLPPRAIVYGGETLAVPSLYVAAVSMARQGQPAAELTLPGPSVAAILGNTGDANGGVRLERGKARLSWSPSTEPPILTIGTGDRDRLATLGVDGGSLLLMVESGVPSGRIGEAAVVPDVRLFVEDGVVTLGEVAAAPRTKVAAGRSTVLFRDVPPEDADPPRWAGRDLNAGSVLDRRYRGLFAEAFPADGNLVDGLAAMEADPRFRISQIATETLGLIGEVRPVVWGLTAEHSETRQTAIDETRRTLATRPAVVDEVREVVGTIARDGDQSIILDLLRGIDRDSLRSQSLSARMTDYLASDNRIIRELAAAQMRRHNIRLLDYQPDDAAAQRSTTIRRLRDRLKSQKSWVQPPLDDAAPATDLNFPFGE